MKIEDFSIEIRKTVSRGKLLGVAALCYLDPEATGFRLRGFKIMKGTYETGYTDKNGEPMWVAPPGYADPVTSKMVNIFFMPKHLWHDMETRILEAFSKLKE